MTQSIKWDIRFLELARHISSWSKDPSTKCGAVITDDNRIVSLGYNGFPRNIKDHSHRLADRDTKYKMVLHAEVNAMMFARRSLDNCTMYIWPMPPCSRCAASIVQSGISRIVSIIPSKEHLDRWGDDIEIARVMYNEAGIEYHLYVTEQIPDSIHNYQILVYTDTNILGRLMTKMVGKIIALYNQYIKGDKNG